MRSVRGEPVSYVHSRCGDYGVSGHGSITGHGSRAGHGSLHSGRKFEETRRLSKNLPPYTRLPRAYHVRNQSQKYAPYVLVPTEVTVLSHALCRTPPTHPHTPPHTHTAHTPHTPHTHPTHAHTPMEAMNTANDNKRKAEHQSQAEHGAKKHKAAEAAQEAKKHKAAEAAEDQAAQAQAQAAEAQAQAQAQAAEAKVQVFKQILSHKGKKKLKEDPNFGPESFLSELMSPEVYKKYLAMLVDNQKAIKRDNRKRNAYIRENENPIWKAYYDLKGLRDIEKAKENTEERLAKIKAYEEQLAEIRIEADLAKKNRRPRMVFGAFVVSLGVATTSVPPSNGHAWSWTWPSWPPCSDWEGVAPSKSSWGLPSPADSALSKSSWRLPAAASAADSAPPSCLNRTRLLRSAAFAVSVMVRFIVRLGERNMGGGGRGCLVCVCEMWSERGPRGVRHRACEKTVTSVGVCTCVPNFRILGEISRNTS